MLKAMNFLVFAMQFSVVETMNGCRPTSAFPSSVMICWKSMALSDCFKEVKVMQLRVISSKFSIDLRPSYGTSRQRYIISN